MPEPIVLALMLPLGVLSLGTAFVQAWFIVRDRRLGWVSMTWPTVEAVVISSELDCGDEFDRPIVTYRYRVGEQEFTGNLLAFTTIHFRSPAKAARHLRTPGSSLQVSYDPNNPSTSVINPGPQPQTSAVVGTLIFLIMGLGTLIGLWF